MLQGAAPAGTSVGGITADSPASVRFPVGGPRHAVLMILPLDA